MQRLVALGIPWALGACVSNTIVLETDSDDTGDVATTTTTTTTVTTSPGSITAPAPTTTTTTTAGPSSAITTDPVPPPLFDIGALDTGAEPTCDPPCGPTEICIEGTCFEDPDFTTGQECGLVPGQWADCVLDDGTPDDAACQSPVGQCATTGAGPAVGGCIFVGCFDACDCPLAPPGSGAEVACEMSPAIGSYCFLDCSSGQPCPAGMICSLGSRCQYPV